MKRTVCLWVCAVVLIVAGMAMADNQNQNVNQNQNQNQAPDPADCVACPDQNQSQNQNQNQNLTQDPADCGNCRNLTECGACLQVQLELQACGEDSACVGERVQAWMQQREELEQCLQERLEEEIANDGVVAWLQTRSRFTERVQNRIQNYLEQGGCADNPEVPCDPAQTRTREQARLYVDGLCMDFAVLRDGGVLHIPEAEITLMEDDKPVVSTLMLDLQWVDGALVVTNVALADPADGSLFPPATFVFDADNTLHIPLVGYTLITPSGAERVLYFELDLELQDDGGSLTFIVTNLERIVPEDWEALES